MKRLLRSFGYAFRGIAVTFRSEPNARIHLGLSALAALAGWFLDLSATEWCLIVGCIGTVIGAECLNTAIEKLADALHPEDHPLVGQAKDAAAAGVLLTAIAAGGIGLIIFLPKVFGALSPTL